MSGEEEWVRDVLGFWFEELSPQDWFAVDKTLDDRIRTRFGALYRQLVDSIGSFRAETADRALAAILVFDQFPRNMFRGQAQAFATDDLASMIARKAIERGLDRAVPDERRVFFYLPLMHSENMADQELCVSLCSDLPGDTKKYAMEHRDIIARFGRFPHRNAALGRESTEREKDFLAEHKGYGQ
jgi:uncharacterized protein (DUF924 family)